MSVHALRDAGAHAPRLWLRLSRRLLVTGTVFRVTRGTKLRARTFFVFFFRLATELHVIGVKRRN